LPYPGAMLRRRAVPAVALLGGLALTVPAAHAARTQTTPTRIPAGVTVGGLDVSGLTVLQAAQKIKTTAAPILATQDVVLGVAGKPWTLTAADAKLKVNGTKTAEAALKATSGTDVKLVVSYSTTAVKSFVGSIAGKVAKPGRDAKISIGTTKITITGSTTGQALDQDAAIKQVEGALADPTANKTLHQKLVKTKAKVTYDTLRKQYASVITVDQATFKLRLFKSLKLAKTYSVAVGMPAHPTPRGTFRILDKQVNPVWSVPNSEWAGELAGTTVEGGSAANPLKARWMGLGDGIGIHGTGEDASIGSRASHGCIRMHVADVEALFSRVSVGTTVVIR
jgi:lipoprotein-anchoring transpeptidase ErfK/SrfK